MKKIYLIKNSRETQRLGEIIAKEVICSKKLLSDTVVLELVGDLGGGKTTFLQGFAKGLGIKEKILSPTFVVMRKFKFKLSKNNNGYIGLYHIDCYRIRNHKDFAFLGLNDHFSQPGNIFAIEWPERIAKILPKNTIKLHFVFVDKNTRKITINS